MHGGRTRCVTAGGRWCGMGAFARGSGGRSARPRNAEVVVTVAPIISDSLIATLFE